MRNGFHASARRGDDQLSVASGLSVRSLQRLFAGYVGVSPKWVMRRARLHEAAARADGGEPVDWAALARDLGYADQAHLTRDFAATIGVPPSRYAAAPLGGRCRYRGWPNPPPKGGPRRSEGPPPLHYGGRPMRRPGP